VGSRAATAAQEKNEIAKHTQKQKKIERKEKKTKLGRWSER
jgi:hypothetical protein